MQFTFRLALISDLNKRTLQFETSIVTIQKIPWGLDSGKVAQLLNLKGNYKEEGGRREGGRREGELFDKFFVAFIFQLKPGILALNQVVSLETSTWTQN